MAARSPTSCMLLRWSLHAQRLVVLATIWFVALFAPLVCILHCHVLALPTFHPTGQLLFVCHMPHAAAVQQPPPTTLPARAPLLPRILYDLLLTASLLLPVLVQVRDRVAHSSLALASYAYPPPTPPPR